MVRDETSIHAYWLPRVDWNQVSHVVVALHSWVVDTFYADSVVAQALGVGMFASASAATEDGAIDVDYDAVLESERSLPESREKKQ